MKIKITPRKPQDTTGIACLPMVKNIPVPKAKDWKKVVCKACGEECWESDLARQLSSGTAAACTTCTLKAGLNRR